MDETETDAGTAPVDGTAVPDAAPDAGVQPAQDQGVPAQAQTGQDPAGGQAPDGPSPDGATSDVPATDAPASAGPASDGLTSDGPTTDGVGIPADPTAGTTGEVIVDSGTDGMFGGIGGIIDAGGPIVALLLVMSVVALTIIIAKLMQFARFGRGNSKACSAAVVLWCRGEVEAGRDAIAGLGGPIARVLGLGMDGLLQGRDETHVRERVEQAAADALAQSRSYLRGLEAIAQAAPLLGLLGTVLGMIDAFKVLEASGGDVDPAGLAGGIWVALLTTAVGLGVSIPISFVLHWFDARVDRERQDLERLATAVLTHPPHPAHDRDAEPVALRPVGARIHAH